MSTNIPKRVIASSAAPSASQKPPGEKSAAAVPSVTPEAQLRTFRSETLVRLDKSIKKVHSAATFMMDEILFFADAAEGAYNAAQKLWASRRGIAPALSQNKNTDEDDPSDYNPTCFTTDLFEINMGGQIAKYKCSDLKEIRKQYQITLPFMMSSSLESEASRDHAGRPFFDGSPVTLSKVIEDAIEKLNYPQAKKLKTSPSSPKNTPHPLLLRTHINRPSVYEKSVSDALTHPGDPRPASKEYTRSPKPYTPFTIDDRSKLITPSSARIVNTLLHNAVPYLAFKCNHSRLTSDEIKRMQRNLFHERKTLFIIRTRKLQLTVFCANRLPDPEEEKARQDILDAEAAKKESDPKEAAQKKGDEDTEEKGDEISEEKVEGSSDKEGNSTTDAKKAKKKGDAAVVKGDTSETDEIFFIFEPTPAADDASPEERCPSLFFKPKSRCQLVGFPLQHRTKDGSHTLNYQFVFGNEIQIYHTDGLFVLSLPGFLGTDNSLLFCPNNPMSKKGSENQPAKELYKRISTQQQHAITSFEAFVLDGELQSRPWPAKAPEFKSWCDAHHNMHESKPFISFPAKAKTGGPKPQPQLKNFVGDVVIPVILSHPDVYDPNNEDTEEFSDIGNQSFSSIESMTEFASLLHRNSNLLKVVNSTIRDCKNITDRYNDGVESALRQVAWFDACSTTPTVPGKKSSTSIVRITYGPSQDRRELLTTADTLQQFPGSRLSNIIRFGQKDRHPTRGKYRSHCSHVLPYSQSSPEELDGRFHVWIESQARGIVNVVGHHFMQDVARNRDKIFTNEMITKSSQDRKWAMFTVLGSDGVKDPFKRYMRDMEFLCTFHDDLVRTQGYICIDLVNEAIDPDCVEIIIEHMRATKLARLGVTADPGALDPGNFPSDISNKLLEAMKTLDINPELY